MAIVSAMGGMTDKVVAVVDSALEDFDRKRNLYDTVERQVSTLRELAPPESRTRSSPDPPGCRGHSKRGAIAAHDPNSAGSDHGSRDWLRRDLVGPDAPRVPGNEGHSVRLDRRPGDPRREGADGGLGERGPPRRWRHAALGRNELAHGCVVDEPRGGEGLPGARLHDPGAHRRGDRLRGHVGDRRPDDPEAQRQRLQRDH